MDWNQSIVWVPFKPCYHVIVFPIIFVNLKMFFWWYIGFFDSWTFFWCCSWLCLQAGVCRFVLPPKWSLGTSKATHLFEGCCTPTLKLLFLAIHTSGLFAKLTGYRWCPQGITWYHKASHGIAWYHMVSCDVIRYHMVPQNTTRYPQGVTRYHMVSQGITWYHEVSHGTTWCHKVSDMLCMQQAACARHDCAKKPTSAAKLTPQWVQAAPFSLWSLPYVHNIKPQPWMREYHHLPAALLHTAYIWCKHCKPVHNQHVGCWHQLVLCRALNVLIT